MGLLHNRGSKPCQMGLHEYGQEGTAEVREHHFSRCPDTGRGGFNRFMSTPAAIEAFPGCRVQEPCEALYEGERSCMQPCQLYVTGWTEEAYQYLSTKRLHHSIS